MLTKAVSSLICDSNCDHCLEPLGKNGWLTPLARTKSAPLFLENATRITMRIPVEEDVNRNRTLGLAVQDVVRQCMENRGFKLELIDRGYDYDVTLPDGDPLLDGAYRLEIGPWMMEVKATTSGDVRMTPTQAERASIEPDRYLLCVVDLRDTSDEERRGPWTTDFVEPRAWIAAQQSKLMNHAVLVLCDIGWFQFAPVPIA